MKIERFCLMALVVACSACGWANPKNANTDWMPGKVGAFMHFLPAADEQRERVEKFDVNGLRDQLLHMGVDYFFFTLGQNNNFYNSDNTAYRGMMGTNAVTRFSSRDLPREIIAALKGTGIRFGLYLPCQPSFHDEVAEKAFGFEQMNLIRPGDWRMTDCGAANWAKVIEVWSTRYGEDVSLWWFDGARPDMSFSETHGRMFRQAVLKGNPTAVVSFNCGLLDASVETAYGRRCEEDPDLPLRIPLREYCEQYDDMIPPENANDCDDPMKWTGGRCVKVEQVQWMKGADYTPGEVAEPFRFMPESRWFKTNQYHLITYLGHYWGERHCRYPDEIWIKYLKHYLANGGCISIDMSIDRKDKSGRFVSAHVNQLRRILRAVRHEQ